MANYIHVPDEAPAVPKIDVTVDESDYRPGALKLIKALRPSWKPSEVKIKFFTDGITNKLLGCYVGTVMQDVVLVRIYGNKTELLVDRENEVKSFRVLHAHRCAPRLYCTFNNGLCYEFLQGTALEPEHIRSQPVFRLNLEVPSPRCLREELLWLQQSLSMLGSPVVLCHNDLLCKNIIYNQEEDNVKFIDYEYAGYNYQAYDIGNHFNEFAGLNEVDYSYYPARAFQLQWLRSYLEAYKEHKGQGSDVTDREVEILYVQVNQFALASHFIWGLWALIQAKFSTIDFDFLGYAVLRFNQYFKMKPEVIALSLPE
ncbi:ethanolamine kinase 1 isoform X3 [Echeneis naucrates]|uniref:ethanolamine kinase 1 isoform X3 n=1 Tax=Echeneis naucrates TaxID=173247 RepID=UPI001113E1D8|nr:ethanolamine kinase 1 isoform X3 [Echeneis naucrates]